MSARLRVLVVDDSLTVRKQLCTVLEAAPGIEVVGEAADGKQAIELCQSLRPDLVTLDMMMPVMTGLAATEYIMAYCPTPILVVSASINRGELFKTYEALAAGAVEVMDKPGGDTQDENWEARFIAMVRLVSRVRVVTHLRGRSAPPPPALVPTTQDRQSVELVAIGASTGAPRAVVEVLHKLPANFSLPVLLVVHIGEPFGSAFADWLDGQSTHRVRMAKEGAEVDGPGVWLAVPNRHLQLQGRTLRLDQGPERFSCRPSVDVLFESVAASCGAAAAGVILTGMGQDGARGLLAMRRAGAVTIAQDEASSVVYGMPREAALLGAAQRILPLPDIGAALGALARRAP
jgi:two-component system, chemotaxis family, protein-glutamate methylesterase/glutaminase